VPGVPLAKAGQHFTLPVKLRRLEGNRCHHNVASLWERRKKRSRLKAIATGYDLTRTACGARHTWGITATQILETTLVRLRYFGISLKCAGVDAFAAAFRSRCNPEGRVAELGIFLPIKLPAKAEVVPFTRNQEPRGGTRICVAAGPAIKNARRNELQKCISRREDSRRDAAPLTFLASL
jgi:hypothetical protein